MNRKDTITTAFSTLNLVIQEKKRIDEELRVRQEIERLERIAKDNRHRDEYLEQAQKLVFSNVPNLVNSSNQESADVNPVIHTFCKMFADELTDEKYEKLEVFSKKLISSEPNESAYISAKRKIEPEFGVDVIKHFETLRTAYIGTALPAVRRVLKDGMLDEEAVVLNMSQLLDELAHLPEQIAERLIGDTELREIRFKLIKATIFSLTLVDETIKAFVSHLEHKTPQKFEDILGYVSDSLSWAPDDITHGIFNEIVRQCIALKEKLNADSAKHMVSALTSLREKLENRVAITYSHASMAA